MTAHTSHGAIEAITKSESTSGDESAVTTVLHVPELIEHILCQLPCTELLLAQRVCRFWHTTITNSPKIQKGLFLQPIKAALAENTSFLGSEKPIACTRARFLLHPDIEWLCMSQIPAQVIYDLIRDAKRKRPLSNPFLGTLFPRYINKSRRAYQIDIGRLKNLPVDGSWRKMWVTQPPTTRIRISRLPKFMGNEIFMGTDITRFVRQWDGRSWENPRIRIRRGSTAVLENDIGIRMDELIEFVLREFDKGEDFYFIRR